MLSYQHTYHAGNHADVIKHLTLTAILEKLHIKTKPFFYADTHAGNGCYAISGQAHQDEVIAKLLCSKKNLPAQLKAYKKAIFPYIDKQMYPGSPLLVANLIEQYKTAEHNSRNNNMHLNELHPQAYTELKEWCRDWPFQIHNRDGFELLNALMPPKPNRGVVLIDPPYEQASEYEELVDTVKLALKKWPNGTFAIWYPLLSPQRIDRKTKEIEDTPKHGFSEQMLEELKPLASKGLLNIRYVHQAPSHENAMYGSGMAVINPPWQLDVNMQEILDYLATEIQADDNTLSKIEFLVPLA